eukprot:scaffold13034_cov119-Cylindrotheca_fusiformis.AAC.5
MGDENSVVPCFRWRDMWKETDRAVERSCRQKNPPLVGLRRISPTSSFTTDHWQSFQRRISKKEFKRRGKKGHTMEAK